MTSTPTDKRPFHPAELGTLAVMAWSGEHPDERGDLAFLLAYALGDGPGGPEGTSAAVRTLLENTGLPVGGPVVDATTRPSFPVSLLVEAGQAVVNMPQLNAQCLVPPEWLAAVRERGHAYFIFATRPWPEGSPGVEMTQATLSAFAGDEEMLAGAAHCLLPARSLRT
ncbi:DUF5949 family protein [Streptomyces sp. NPDC127068]|uniref:DUF5949 family protein n=1 Tax=Streptomyces sp. NPDC127068 TaxID=3347127 RepID=UPI003655E35D